MKNIISILTCATLLMLTACSIDEVTDPNGVQLATLLENAEIGDLNALVNGTEARMRRSWDVYVTSTGSVSRELYLFDADPRNTEDLLGKEGTSLDNNTFYLTAPYTTRYQTVLNCNILLRALDNTPEGSAAQKDGYRGFANTIKALMFLQELGRLNTNGIRVDVADPENLGPILSKDAAFDAIFDLLNTAYGQLQGAEFAFQLSSGFDDFDTPETFAQFNRAIAARAAIYAERYDQVQGFLDDSFLEDHAALDLGPKHVFSTASGDFLNPMFKAPQQSGDQIIVHDSIVNNIREDDARISKFRLRNNPTSQDDLNGDYELAIYESSTSPISILRNEELILIAAEANIQTGKLPDAVNYLNIIRNAYGLGNYAGPETEEALTDEMLYHRTYSLFAEGHRMFDLRRYGLLNSTFLPIDREGDQVFTEFPLPLSEQ